MHQSAGKRASLTGLLCLALLGASHLSAQSGPYAPYGPTGTGPGTQGQAPYGPAPYGSPAGGFGDASGWAGGNVPQTPGAPVSGTAAAAYLATIPTSLPIPAGQESPGTPTPTAAAQGFGRSSPGLEAWKAASKAARSTPRQKGTRVHQPAPLDPVGSDPGLDAWVQAWTEALCDIGVPASKVSFEASRLDAEAFARWGSRQVWASGLRVTAVPGAARWHVDVDPGKSP